MLKLYFKRKPILRRDQTVFGTYVDYELKSPVASFSRNQLSARQRTAFFRYFLEQFIDRVHLGLLIAPGTHVIISCEHEYLNAPNVEPLISQLAAALALKKCHLVVELDSRFPEFRSGIRAILKRSICGYIYKLIDKGLLFSLRCAPCPDELTWRLIEGRVFTFLAVNSEFCVCAASCEEECSSTACVKRIMEYMERGGFKLIANRIYDRQQFDKASGMPFLFFCGDYLAPETTTEIL